MYVARLSCLYFCFCKKESKVHTKKRCKSIKTKNELEKISRLSSHAFALSVARRDVLCASGRVEAILVPVVSAVRVRVRSRVARLLGFAEEERKRIVKSFGVSGKETDFWFRYLCV